MLGSSAVRSFLASHPQAERADLFTLTLASGSVYRYTSAGQDVTIPYVGTFAAGGQLTASPVVRRGSISWALGFETSTLSVEFLCQASTMLGATPFAKTAATGALKGATLTVERLVMASWGDMTYSGDLIWLFTGDVGSVDAEPSVVKVTVESAVQRVRNRQFPIRTITPDIFPFLPEK